VKLLALHCEWWWPAPPVFAPKSSYVVSLHAFLISAPTTGKSDINPITNDKGRIGPLFFAKGKKDTSPRILAF